MRPHLTEAGETMDAQPMLPGSSQSARGQEEVRAFSSVAAEGPLGFWDGGQEPPPNGLRRVLIVASRFPPVASVGATRVRKFAKYLRRFGWDPIVITGATRRAEPSAHDARRATDHESLIDLPADLAVHRLSAVLDNWPGFAARRCAAVLARWTRPMGADESSWSSLLKWRLQRLHDRLSFPDRGIWRLPAAVQLVMKLHRRHRFDAVFSSGMPFSDHLVGLAIHAAIRRPWLADFRDPWVEYIHWQQWHSGGGRRLTRWAESAVVQRAAWVISVNEYMTRRFQTRYASRVGNKFVTIANGFDPSDFPLENEQAPNRQFTLMDAGSLDRTRSPQTLLTAFRRFLEEVPGSREHARFDFAGRPGPHVDELHRASDDGRIRYLGMLPHAQALRAMASADVNVVILPNLPGSENDTTAKLYECLGSGRAILGAVPLDGAAAAALREHEGVSLCDPDDVEGLTNAIVSMYRRWLSGDLQPHRLSTRLRPLTREYQTQQLAACLDAAVVRGKRPWGASR